MTRIKICGLFREADIAAVNEARPDFAGFVFASSRRQVSPEQSAALSRLLDPAIVPVGVFVDEPVENIVALFQEGTIRIAQLHGQETEATIEALKRLADIPVIKAIRVSRPADILAWSTTVADFLLLDNGPGGTGQSFDWRLIPPIDKRWFLAGGLDEHNIRQALSLSPPPWCLDVSSGAETNGVKDRAKILNLVRLAREGR